jgi:hypothetical protein
MPLQHAALCPPLTYHQHHLTFCSHTSRFNGGWYQAVIVQRLAGGASARVHFKGWGSNFSEVSCDV